MTSLAPTPSGVSRRKVDAKLSKKNKLTNGAAKSQGNRIKF